jgi:hypothetical protein
VNQIEKDIEQIAYFSDELNRVSKDPAFSTRKNRNIK